MSKTDKTRPWGIRLKDEPRWLVPNHDHRTGTCDLPEVAELHAGDRCRWTWTDEAINNPANACGCKMCNDTHGRRAKRKRERKTARRYAAVLWRTEHE